MIAGGRVVPDVVPVAFGNEEALPRAQHTLLVPSAPAAIKAFPTPAQYRCAAPALISHRHSRTTHTPPPPPRSTAQTHFDAYSSSTSAGLG
eukprot:3149526-Rhodomonas_salina.1